MTIIDLLLYIGVTAVAMSLTSALLLHRKEEWLMTYLQHFCGALFLFSGYVKAVDPLGTAFKMEQYFAEFYYTFNETALSGIAPMFPWLSQQAVLFSVGMIVFEIVLGVMLILGTRPKLTAWMFLLLVAFFTILTGFTYLTGYVPSGVNFFSFGSWGPYVETNMRVTDCGCFGDFLKLKPRTSFLKDVFLLFPALYFVLRPERMHQLFTPAVQRVALGTVTALVFVFCWRNVSWDEPVADFRPFREGADVRTRKEQEAEAQANVRITHYRMTNKESGEVVMLPMEEYMKQYQSYPKDAWNLEQIKTEPEIEPTKISDFDISDLDGNNVTEDILSEQGYSFMVTAYKLKSKDPAYLDVFGSTIRPFVDAAGRAGYKVFGVTAPNDPAVVDDFRHATQLSFPFFVADDLLLKTIQRSNPGVVLWKDGKVVRKWHYRKLPPFESVAATLE
ncbi:MAG: hypothetical protein RLY31_111 [Bacteroidota bacterium]|jgi:uncharacterized membrane protein YphA (DoxX/SURF4 family)